MLHQLVGVVEFAERTGRKSKRFGEQTDKAVALLLHMIQIRFQGISETQDELLVRPLAWNPHRQLASPAGRITYLARSPQAQVFWGAGSPLGLMTGRKIKLFPVIDFTPGEFGAKP